MRIYCQLCSGVSLITVVYECLSFVFVCACLCLCACLHVCMCAYVHACMCVWLFARMCVCVVYYLRIMCVICVYVRMYDWMDVFTCTQGRGRGGMWRVFPFLLGQFNFIIRLIKYFPHCCCWLVRWQPRAWLPKGVLAGTGTPRVCEFGFVGL